MRAFSRAACAFFSDFAAPPSLAMRWQCSARVTIVVQPVDFTLDVPNGLAQILHCVALTASPPQVFNGVADAKIVVLCDGDALNAGRMPGVVIWMVYRVGWLLHPCTLPNPASLSSGSFSSKAQTPLFHEVNMQPLAGSPCAAYGKSCYSPAGTSPASNRSASCILRVLSPAVLGHSLFISRIALGI